MGTRRDARPTLTALAAGFALLCAVVAPSFGQGGGGGGGSATGGDCSLNDFRGIFDPRTLPKYVRLTVFPTPSIGRVEIHDLTHGTPPFTLAVDPNAAGPASTTFTLPPDIHYSTICICTLLK